MDLRRLLDGAGNAAAAQPLDITGLTADSREVKPGNLFAAFAGTRLDGTRFIADAAARGAVAVLAAPGVGVPAGSGLAIVEDDNPRRALALMAARFFERQPDTMVAVTGTNGKTSVASFLRQIWRAAGMNSASLGTVGVTLDGDNWPLRHTTPDPVELHRQLRRLADVGVTHAVLEASSHGLAQHRVDGVRFAAGAFTNLTRDHLDYHGSLEDYRGDKLRLFTEVLEPGAGAVVQSDGEHAQIFARAAKLRGLRVMRVGRKGADLRLSGHRREGFGQRLTIAHDGRRSEVLLPLVGDFQADNALVAAGLAILCGLPSEQAVSALADLTGARGRLELVGHAPCGAPVFVDYAHTPDALGRVLDALRPYAAKRLIAVFGAGGDRDAGKRAPMGQAVAARADIAIVTDDNPRTEDPATIRSAVLAGAPEAIEIGDRATAIAAGVRMLRAGDVLLVAGKGHEEGQDVGTHVIPFSDHRAVGEALKLEAVRG